MSLNRENIHIFSLWHEVFASKYRYDIYEENRAIASEPQKAKIISIKNNKRYRSNESAMPAKKDEPILGKKKRDESKIIFSEYKMPPQPQGYLKYPKYDFY